jgi:prepilin-type N-terminal cleavage/methylation domain-containing protein
MQRTALAASRGYSLVEVACVIAIAGAAASVGVPQVLTTLDELRTSGAARHLAARLQRARMDAVLRSADVGLQVTQIAAGYSYAVYVDGNRNGVRTSEIQQGTDRRLVAPERLSDHFPGVDFGAIAGLPPVDSGGTPPGSDPVRLGSGNLATFAPSGTSSSGTLYVRGRRDTQYAVRIYGQTGKVRVLKFDLRSRQWIPS